MNVYIALGLVIGGFIVFLFGVAVGLNLKSWNDPSRPTLFPDEEFLSNEDYDPANEHDGRLN